MKRSFVILSLAALLPASLPLFGQTVRIVQTNSMGDTADVIDPATNKIVLSIPDLERAHGVAFSPDGHLAYFSVEGNETVAKVDLKTGKTLAIVKLTGHPNNISASKDGKYLFIALTTRPGKVDIVDTAGDMKVVKSIEIPGSGHNTHVTPDGKYAVGTSVGGKSITAINIANLEKEWDLIMDLGVRPLSFSTKPDGSTDKMYFQLSDCHCFSVVDFDTRKEVARVELPDEPLVGKAKASAPAHGIAVTPDQKTLVVNSSLAGGVYIYSLPDLKYEGYVATGQWPDWVTITPDSKTAYVANSGSDVVTVVDIPTRKKVAEIPVGKDPKRNGTVVMR